MANELYEIVSQREQPDIDDAGRFSRFMIVTFKTRDGAVASVKIPEEKYTPDYVVAQVVAKAQTMTQIHNS